jgi:hypothetical protein
MQNDRGMDHCLGGALLRVIGSKGRAFGQVHDQSTDQIRAANSPDTNPHGWADANRYPLHWKPLEGYSFKIKASQLKGVQATLKSFERLQLV